MTGKELLDWLLVLQDTDQIVETKVMLETDHDCVELTTAKFYTKPGTPTIYLVSR